MNETRDLLERVGERFTFPDDMFERLERRRERKRRNQRIAAGVVGIAVFVAAVWIVTSGRSLDRSEKSVAPAGEVTGPAETGPAETAPPPALASAAPDVVKQGRCSDGARWRLGLTDLGDRIRVRFEVHQSPVGHRWRIHFAYKAHNLMTIYGSPFFGGTRVASDSGDVVAQLSQLEKGGARSIPMGSMARPLIGRQVRSARCPPGISSSCRLKKSSATEWPRARAVHPAAAPTLCGPSSRQTRLTSEGSEDPRERRERRSSDAALPPPR